MIFYSSAQARTRGAPSETHTFAWFRRAIVRPPSPPRRKKSPLREAWKGSRLRAWSNTQNHCKVLRFRTRNSYHLPRIITTRTPFSPDRTRKRCKGCHCAQATERHRAQTTESRQTPPQAKRCGFLEKTTPGAGGWDRGLPQPPPSPVSLFAVFQSHRTHSPIST